MIHAKTKQIIIGVMKSGSFQLAQGSINLSVDSSIEVVREIKEIQQLLEPFTISELPKRKIDKEFQLLNKMTFRDSNLERLDKSSHNMPLNRYSDVLPYLDSIVKLDSGSKNEPPVYINANFIHSPYELGNLNNFIATQGPLKRTADHFWRMVEQFDVRLIVAIVEKGAMDSKCYQYWPSKNALETEEYAITISQAEDGPFAHRKVLTVVNKETGRSFEVIHFHIINWVDMAELQNSEFEAFISLIDELRTISKGKKAPIVVHCSAGVGRTGSFICAYYLHGEWLKAKKEAREFTFSIFALVRHIREQRFGAVQTLQQYRFLHEIVKHF